MKCIICGKREATVPDRNQMSRKKRLCSQCHSDRLRTDLTNILNGWKRKEEENIVPVNSDET
jgi:hypothetical protein